MGMIGEALAASEAEKLERILYRIAESENSLERKSANDLTNLELIHWYISACSEAFMEPNHALLKRFNDYE